MATFTVQTAAGFNMEALQLFNLFEKTSETRTATQYRTSFDALNYTRFDGAGLTYGGTFPDTTLTGGTINSIQDIAGGANVFTLSTTAILAVDLYNFYVAANTQGALAAMLSGNDTLTGNAGNDLLIAYVGNDRLIGGLGADTMIGGAGNDTYVVDNALDAVNEIDFGGSGTADTVESSIDYQIGFGVENLLLTGAALNGAGDSFNNIIIGNVQNNTLNGGGGNDTLQGLAGNDTLTGENGVDVLTGGTGNDTLDGGADNDIAGGEEGNDTLLGGSGNDILGGGIGNDFLDGGLGADVMDGGDGNDVYVIDDVSDAIFDILGVDRVESSIATTLLGASIENLKLLSGAGTGLGNSLANNIQGNDGDNFLGGDLGNDTIQGGGGVDTISGGNDNDTLHGEGGNDLLDGGSGNDTLWGGNGNDVLNGGSGIDGMRGGLGDDFYLVGEVGDIVIENLNEGIDTAKTMITYALTSNVENLVLEDLAGAISGTGNALDNRITGNNSPNVLNGSTGADVMRGLDGNDTYFVDNVGDLVFEDSAAFNQIDSVTSSVDYRLGMFVENLTLTGTAIKATGNDLANSLTGNIFNNIIDGKQGADTMAGQGGNDTYFIDNFGDTIVEGVGLGIDTVFSSVTYTLEANVDNLTIVGTNTTGGFGNALNNTIIGNAFANSLQGNDGADVIEGGLGQDTMFGGAGSDDFRYTHLAADQDNIFDFTAGSDDIVVSAAAFGGGLAAGVLAGNRLVIGPTGGTPVANQAFGQFLFDKDDGRLIWDQNGTGAGGEFHIATLTFGLGLVPAINNLDFVVIP